jgi:hypothetical protein
MSDISLQEDLNAIAETVNALVKRSDGSSTEILQILRFLEALHRQVCEEHFLPTLPTRRRTLYNLLREIDAEGGWPYIPRMQIRALLTHLEADPNESPDSGDG